MLFALAIRTDYIPPHNIWLNELHQKVNGKIAIALELKKGPVLYALQKYPFVTVFPVHALSLARYRQIFRPNGSLANQNIRRAY